MIRWNGWGFIIVGVGGLLGGMSSYFLRLQDPQALLILGTAWIVMDVIVRLRSRYHPRWLLNRLAGGHIWYAPMWVLGLVIVLVNALLVLTA